MDGTSVVDAIDNFVNEHKFRGRNKKRKTIYTGGSTIFESGHQVTFTIRRGYLDQQATPPFLFMQHTFTELIISTDPMQDAVGDAKMTANLISL